MTERLYEFEITINKTRKLRYATRATSEQEAQKRAKKWAACWSKASLTTPSGAHPDGLYLSR